MNLEFNYVIIGTPGFAREMPKAGNLTSKSITYRYRYLFYDIPVIVVDKRVPRDQPKV